MPYIFVTMKQSEQIGHSNLVSGSVTVLHTHSGGALQGTVSVDPPSITKGTTANVDVSVPGLLTTHKVYVQCQSDLEDGLMCIAAYCPSDGTLRLRISNHSTSTINGANRIWAYQAYV